MKIKDLPKTDRPREKFIEKGATALSKRELLAILLRTGTKGKNVLELAEDILKKHDERRFAGISYRELRLIPGVGPTKAVQILAALELGRRLYEENTGQKTRTVNKFSVVSLFAGCGGLDLGFTGGFDFLGKKYSKRNFEIVWANDIDEAACETFRKYFKQDIVCGDIGKILTGEHDFGFFEKPMPQNADIVLGGFPCQDFSHAGKRKGFKSKRGLLYQSMAEVIKRTKPLVFVAENVRGLLTMNRGEAIRTIVEDFEKLGYHVVYKLLRAADYGVPQTRERVIIVGTRKDKLPPFEHPKTILDGKSWVSLKQAIGDLEDVVEGGAPNHFWSKAKKNNGQGNSVVSADKPGPTMRTEHHGNIEYHWNGKRRLSAREAARIQTFPDDFIFYPSTSGAYKQIGNAVPPVLGWHVATAVEKFLEENLK